MVVPAEPFAKNPLRAASTNALRRSAAASSPETVLTGIISIDNLTPLAMGRMIPDSIVGRSEEHTSELQSLMRISYAVFCLKKKNHDILCLTNKTNITHEHQPNPT